MPDRHLGQQPSIQPSLHCFRPESYIVGTARAAVTLTLIFWVLKRVGAAASLDGYWGGRRCSRSAVLSRLRYVTNRDSFSTSILRTNVGRQTTVKHVVLRQMSASVNHELIFFKLRSRVSYTKTWWHALIKVWPSQTYSNRLASLRSTRTLAASKNLRAEFIVW